MMGDTLLKKNDDAKKIEFVSKKEMDSLKRQALIRRIEKKIDGLGLPKFFRDPVRKKKN